MRIKFNLIQEHFRFQHGTKLALFTSANSICILANKSASQCVVYTQFAYKQIKCEKEHAQEMAMKKIIKQQQQT